MLDRSIKDIGIAWILVVLVALFGIGPAVGDEALLGAPIEDAADTEKRVEESCAPAPGRHRLAARAVRARPPGVSRADHRGPDPSLTARPPSLAAVVPLRC